MGRNPSLQYALKSALREMESYGESKFKYKQQTQQMRSELKKELTKQGYSSQEIKNRCLHIDAAKNKIFSKSTMSTYLREVDKFAKFVKEETGNSRMSIKEAQNYIQPYINKYRDELKADTLNTRLSAICKATNTYIADYDRPIRHYADGTRGVGEAQNDKYNESRALDALTLNRAIGVRRSELEQLELKDIKVQKDGSLKIHTIGKGKKHNVNIVSDKDSKQIIKHYMDLAKKDSRTLLLSDAMIRNDADLHHMRAERAKDVYKQVCDDMRNNPDRRAFYQNQIKGIFLKNNKAVRENMDNPYKCRGYNKQILKERSKPTEFDRTAVLYVSVTVLNHFRSDTSVQHYLTK